MSHEAKGPGAIALSWWSREIGSRDTSSSRGLSARLRRAAPLAVLCEPSVQQLARNLEMREGNADKLVQLVVLLAEIRETCAETLPQRLGGTDAVMSQLRFQRLLRAENLELTDQLRRAIAMVDRRCNVAAFAVDVLNWETTRPRWCFHYFGAQAPEKLIEEKV